MLNSKFKSGKFLGIDIGASKVSAVLVSLARQEYKILKSGDFQWEDNLTKKEILEKITRLIKTVVNGTDIDNIGISVAAILDKARKNVLIMPNMPVLNKFPIKAYFEKLFPMPIIIENDVNCFTLAEYLLGVGKGVESLLGITLGSGVGGGLIISGNLLRGFNGSATEIGHMIIDKDRGLSFEDLASSKFFKRNSFGDPEEVQKRAEKGDKQACRIFENFGFNLGVGLANLVNIIDPQRIVIGGGIANVWPLFIKQAKKTMVDFVISPQAKKTRIFRSKLKQEASALGAGFLINYI